MESETLFDYACEEAMRSTECKNNSIGYLMPILSASKTVHLDLREVIKYVGTKTLNLLTNPG